MALVDYNSEWAQETKNMIDQEGGISEVVQCDVTKEESCQAAVAKTVQLFGALNILVNIGMCHSSWLCMSASSLSHTQTLYLPQLALGAPTGM